MTARSSRHPGAKYSVLYRIIGLVLPVVLLSSSLRVEAQSFGTGFGQSMQQGFGQTRDNALENPLLDRKAPALPEQERTIDDFFPKTDTDFPLPPIYPMKGVAVPGLDAKSVNLLSQFLMVVSDNPPYTTMSGIYKDNRLKNKSSFVTTDCVVHPYFALTNKILRDVIYEKVMPGLSLMLQSMLKVAVADFKLTNDPEVKNDISKNITYIVVALQLLDPDLKLPDLGDATKRADAELIKIARGKTSNSAIYGCPEEFAFFRPNGFYEREPKLRNFFRCRQWLSRIQFPLSDSEVYAAAGGDQAESRFRQSVLLFRCLDKATINGAPAMQTWEKFYRVWQIMGARENPNEHPLLPTDYRSVFKSTNVDFNNLLKSLSEPFFRTKLLLSIRRNRPVELNSSSILTMRSKENHQVEPIVFRFMPLTDEPEIPWFAELAQDFNEDRSSNEATPFALLELYSRGSTIATNILSGNSWRLLPELFQAMPKLVTATERKRAQPGAALDAGSTEGRWAILSNYFKILPENAQPALRSYQWVRRRLLSAAGAWVDSHVALMSAETAKASVGDAPLELPAEPSQTATGKVAVTTRPETPGADAASAANNQTIAAKQIAAAKQTTTTKQIAATKETVATNQTGDSQPEAANASRPPATNYLEPVPTLFKNLRVKMQQTLDDLSSVDYLPAESKKSAQDFINLCLKLEEISKKELFNNQIAREDSRWLANIDEYLDEFPAPLAAVWHLENHTVIDKKGTNTSGANLCIGNPGEVFILMKFGRGETLCRGAVYTYYELPGGAMKPEALERKLSKGPVILPSWTKDFEVQQEKPAQ